MKRQREVLDWLRDRLSVSKRYEEFSIDVLNLQVSLLLARFESELSEDDWWLLKYHSNIHYENVLKSYMNRLGRLIELGLIRTTHRLEINPEYVTYAKTTPLGIATVIRHLELSEVAL